MQSKARTVRDYLAELPPDRRRAIEAVRAVIRKNLDKGFEEGMSYGMIGYFVPHSIYPAGYHCNPKQPLPFAGLASQKGHMSVYLMCLYGSPDQEAAFRADWAKTGKKLDMGKSCIRFRTLDDLALDVLGRAIRRVTVKKYVSAYEALLAGAGRGRPAGASKPAAKKAPASRAARPAPSPKAAGKRTSRRKAAARRA